MILRLLLAIIGWCGILMLQLLLMGIARFFERSSGVRTWYRAYWVPFTFTAIAALIYWIRLPFIDTWPDFTGDPLANVCLLIAGITLFVLGGILQDRMLQGAPP